MIYICAAELSRIANEAPKENSGLSDMTRNDPGKVGRRGWL